MYFDLELAITQKNNNKKKTGFILYSIRGKWHSKVWC